MPDNIYDAIVIVNQDKIIADLKNRLAAANHEITRLEILIDKKEQECDSLLAELDSFRYNQRFYGKEDYYNE